MGHWSVDGDTSDRSYWSDGVYKIHGVTREEHHAGPALPVLNSITLMIRSWWAPRVAEAIELGKPFEFSLRIVRRTGEIRHVHSKGDVIRDERGVMLLAAFSAFFRMSPIRSLQEQRLAESEEKTRTVLENIVDGVITLDIDGNIDSCNPACARDIRIHGRGVHRVCTL